MRLLLVLALLTGCASIEELEPLYEDDTIYYEYVTDAPPELSPEDEKWIESDEVRKALGLKPKRKKK